MISLVPLSFEGFASCSDLGMGGGFTFLCLYFSSFSQTKLYFYLITLSFKIYFATVPSYVLQDIYDLKDQIHDVEGRYMQGLKELKVQGSL